MDELNSFPNLKDLADDYRKAKFEAYHSQSPISIKLLDELEEKREMLENLLWGVFCRRFRAESLTPWR